MNGINKRLRYFEKEKKMITYFAIGFISHYLMCVAEIKANGKWTYKEFAQFKTPFTAVTIGFIVFLFLWPLFVLIAIKADLTIAKSFDKIESEKNNKKS